MFQRLADKLTAADAMEHIDEAVYDSSLAEIPDFDDPLAVLIRRERLREWFFSDHDTSTDPFTTL